MCKPTAQLCALAVRNREADVTLVASLVISRCVPLDSQASVASNSHDSVLALILVLDWVPDVVDSQGVEVSVEGSVAASLEDHVRLPATSVVDPTITRGIVKLRQ